MQPLRLRADLPPRRAGFTLIEAVVSLALLSLIIGSLSSLIIIASRTLDVAAAEASADATESVVNMLTTDLRYATAITQRTSSAITMVVPDRTGDGLEDKIQYIWSGVGGTLTRTVNTDDPEVLLTGVTTFDLAWLEAEEPT